MVPLLGNNKHGRALQYATLRPLTRFGRISRSLIIVVLLIGSLFPAVGGIGLVAVASVLAVPVILYEALRFFPTVHWSVVLVVPVFGLLASHALFVEPSEVYGQDKLSTFLTLTLLSALAATLLRDSKSVETLAGVWILATLVLAGIAIIGWAGAGRAVGFDSNPIWLGRALATGALAALWFAWRKKQYRLAMLAAFSVLAVALLATGSRGPLLGLVAGAVVLSVVGNRMKLRSLALIVLAGIGAIYAIMTLPFLNDGRLAQIIEGEAATDQSRNIFLDQTIPLILREPGGVGFGQWAQNVSVPRQFNYPHNLFLEVFAELGVLTGLVLLLAVVVVAVRLARQSRAVPAAAFVLAALVNESFSVAVSGDLNARTFFFLLALGAVVGSNSPLMRPATAPSNWFMKESTRSQLARHV